MASLVPSLTKLDRAFKNLKKQFIQKHPLEGDSDRSSVGLCLTIGISVFEADKEKILDALKTKIDPSITVKFYGRQPPYVAPIS